MGGMNTADENRLQLVATEIGLGFTFMESARIAYSMGHTEHGDSAYSNAKAAYRGAQRFLGDQSGDNQTDTLQNQLSRLRDALDDFQANLEKS